MSLCNGAAVPKVVPELIDVIRENSMESSTANLIIQANRSQIIIIDDTIQANHSHMIIINSSSAAVLNDFQLGLDAQQEKEVINTADHTGLDELWPKQVELDCPASPTNYKPNMVIREVNHTSPPMHELLHSKRESYRNSAMGRLSKVVEESESFARREIGFNVNIYYMGSSNNHATNYMQSESANASSNSSTQAFLKKRSSEGREAAMATKKKAKKQRSLASILLWPLLKIRNGYISCMMSLDGAGDLSAMVQGATFATNGKHFADLPLAKTDCRNHG